MQVADNEDLAATMTSLAFLLPSITKPAASTPVTRLLAYAADGIVQHVLACHSQDAQTCTALQALKITQAAADGNDSNQASAGQAQDMQQQDELVSPDSATATAAVLRSCNSASKPEPCLQKCIDVTRTLLGPLSKAGPAEYWHWQHARQMVCQQLHAAGGMELLDVPDLLDQN